MCRLCCRCELCSLKRRTINSTTPCVLASSLTLRIFPSHPILDLWWSLFNAPTLSLLLFAPLCSSYFGSLTLKSAQWDRPAAYCPAHPLIPSSPPSLLHAPSITQMFDCRLYLTFGMSLYFHISPVTFPLSHFHHAVTHPSTPRRKGGKGEKKKSLLSPLPYNHTPFSFIV